VPFGAGKVVKLGGKLPVNMNVHVYYTAVKPDMIGHWQTLKKSGKKTPKHD